MAVVPYTTAEQIRIKILENVKDEFIGVLNIAYKDINGHIHWVSESSHDVTSALQNTLRSFMKSLPNDLPRFGTAKELERNFEWATFKE